MANKIIQVKKPSVDKKELVIAIRKSLESINLPKQMYLEKWENVIDVKKFLETHLCIVESKEGFVSDSYAYRLKKALIILGIDINQLAKEILDKKNKKNNMKINKLTAKK